MSNYIRVVIKEFSLADLDNGYLDKEFDPLGDSGKYDLVNSQFHMKDDKVILTLVYKSLA